MQFAEKVKLVRKRLKISQEKMAQLLSVSFSTVNRWEKGKALPSYLTMQKFEALCQEQNITFEEYGV